MTYGVGGDWQGPRVGGAVTEAGGATTEKDRVVTGAAGARAMTIAEDVSLAVTAMLARPLLEPPL